MIGATNSEAVCDWKNSKSKTQRKVFLIIQSEVSEAPRLLSFHRQGKREAISREQSSPYQGLTL